MRAVRFDRFGDVDVLETRDVLDPVPDAGQVLVEVKAAGVNLLDSVTRAGEVQHYYPVEFPAGLGTDIAGTIVAVGPDVTTFAVGDDVWGYHPKRESHATLAAVDATALLPKPAEVSWPVAGSLFIAGAAAYAAVHAVDVTEGDTLVVANAAGGVGSIAVQLARRRGANVIGISGPGNAEWLRMKGVLPVAYGEGAADAIREVANGRVDAFIDAFGANYVELALELGVNPHRVNTLINFSAVGQYGVQALGNNDAMSPEILSDLMEEVRSGRLENPIAATYGLDHVRSAFIHLEERHTHGKIVLIP